MGISTNYDSVSSGVKLGQNTKTKRTINDCSGDNGIGLTFGNSNGNLGTVQATGYNDYSKNTDTVQIGGKTRSYSDMGDEPLDPKLIGITPLLNRKDDPNLLDQIKMEHDLKKYLGKSNDPFPDDNPFFM